MPSRERESSASSKLSTLSIQLPRSKIRFLCSFHRFTLSFAGDAFHLLSLVHITLHNSSSSFRPFADADESLVQFFNFNGYRIIAAISVEWLLCCLMDAPLLYIQGNNSHTKTTNLILWLVSIESPNEADVPFTRVPFDRWKFNALQHTNNLSDLVTTYRPQSQVYNIHPSKSKLAHTTLPIHTSPFDSIAPDCFVRIPSLSTITF